MDESIATKLFILQDEGPIKIELSNLNFSWRGFLISYCYLFLCIFFKGLALCQRKTVL